MDKLRPARLAQAPDGAPCIVADGQPDRPLRLDPSSARQVFLAGNDLPRRWQGRDRFVIVDTDFGLGLNFLVAWQAWHDDPRRCRRLHVVAFDARPLSAADLAAGQRAWPEFADLAGELRRHWPPLTAGMHRLYLDGGQVILTLVFGETTAQLRTLNASVDAFFLAAPVPGDVPAARLAPIARSLSRLAAPGATLASPACPTGWPEALEAAEFAVSVHARPGGEAYRLAGQLRSRRPDRHRPPAERRAIVVGAGIAGSTTAYRLAAAGWQVTVLERAATPATGASCNLAGVFRPLPSADDNRLSRLTRAGHEATRALLAALPDARWQACGVLHLGRDAEHLEQQGQAVAALGLPDDLLRFVDREEAGQLLGWPVASGGWWFPDGGWVQPPSVCRAALAAFPERIDCRFGVEVDRLAHGATGWRAHAADGRVLAEAPVLVMAGGTAATRFAQFAWLPQFAARGQVSHLPADVTPATRAVVVSKHGYAMPEVDGLRLIGATSQDGDTDTGERLADHRDNLMRLERFLPGFAPGLDPAALHGRVGLRPMSPDRLPMVGPLPDFAASGGRPGRLHDIPRLPGLWCVQGFGARGIVWSALMADLLLSRLEGEPLPLAGDLVDALDPGRFLVKAGRRPG